MQNGKTKKKLTISGKPKTFITQQNFENKKILFNDKKFSKNLNKTWQF